MDEIVVNQQTFLRILKDADLPSEELFRLEREVEELMESPGWELIEKLVATERVKQIAQFEGRLGSYEQMARRSGTLMGLGAWKHAASAIKTAAERAREQIEALPAESAGEGGG